MVSTEEKQILEQFLQAAKFTRYNNFWLKYFSKKQYKVSVFSIFTEPIKFMKVTYTTKGDLCIEFTNENILVKSSFENDSRTYIYLNMVLRPVLTEIKIKIKFSDFYTLSNITRVNDINSLLFIAVTTYTSHTFFASITEIYGSTIIANPERFSVATRVLYFKFSAQTMCAKDLVELLSTLKLDIGEHYVHIPFDVFYSWAECEWKKNPETINAIVPVAKFSNNCSGYYITHYDSCECHSKFFSSKFSVLFYAKFCNIYLKIGADQLKRTLRFTMDIQDLSNFIQYYPERATASNIYSYTWLKKNGVEYENLSHTALLALGHYSKGPDNVDEIYVNKFKSTVEEEMFLTMIITDKIEKLVNNTLPKRMLNDIVSIVNNPLRAFEISNTLISLVVRLIVKYTFNDESIDEALDCLCAIVSNAPNYDLIQVLKLLRPYMNTNYKVTPIIEYNGYSEGNKIFLLANYDYFYYGMRIPDLQKIGEILISFYNNKVNYEIIKLFNDIGIIVSDLRRFDLDYGYELLDVMAESRLQKEYIDNITILSECEKLLYISIVYAFIQVKLGKISKTVKNIIHNVYGGKIVVSKYVFELAKYVGMVDELYIYYKKVESIDGEEKFEMFF